MKRTWPSRTFWVSQKRCDATVGSWMSSGCSRRAVLSGSVVSWTGSEMLPRLSVPSSSGSGAGVAVSAGARCSSRRSESAGDMTGRGRVRVRTR
mgnify:CR=1 FL=1